MVHYSVRDAAKKIQSDAYYAAVACSSADCPLFSGCSQLPSMGRKYSKNPFRFFFVFNSPQPDDVETGVAAVSSFFRDNWLIPFQKELNVFTNYLISYLVRSPLLDSKELPRNPTTNESAYCWDHFWIDLMEYKPKALILFGEYSFQQLYNKAINKDKLPRPEDQTVVKLRKNIYQIEFSSDYSVDVTVCYDPMRTSTRDANKLIEDRTYAVNFLCPNRKDIKVSQINIDTIDRLETVKDTLDFFDFLNRGLPKKEMFDLAFDTETSNLNRNFNNKFLSWQFSYKPGHAVFIPIDHPQKPVFADTADKRKLIGAFQTFLNSTPEKTRIAWIIAHNAKFDLSVLYGLFRILPKGEIPIWDTMLAMHWLDENRTESMSLKVLGKEYFNFSYKTEALEAREDGDLAGLSYDDLVEYGGSDTILTWHLKQKQMILAQGKGQAFESGQQPDDALDKLDRFMRYYYSPASRAIALMECNGLHVSKPQLQYLQGDDSPIWTRILRIETDELQNSPEVLEFKKQYSQVISGGTSNVDYEDDLWGESSSKEDTASLTFSPGKKDQDNAFYLDFLKLEPLAFSKKTSKPKLDKNFLNHYAAREVYLGLPQIKPYLQHYQTPVTHEDDGDPVYPKNPLQLILELRELTKLGSTYLESIYDTIVDKTSDSIDGRIRASFWLAGTDTGRLASSNPNLQNLPAGRSKMAKEIKNLFQAEAPSKKYPEGTALIQLDYKTAEVRWAAIFAKDQNLIRVFNEARDALLAACDPSSNLSDEEFEATQLASDIHRRTASLMYGVPPDKVSKDMRQASKGITFGLLFGMGIETLASSNNWSVEEAEKKVEMFFSAFPQLRAWLDANPKRAEKQKYVETLMGRRRRLGFLYMNNSFKDKAKASRLSKNAPIQGQSSDAGILGLVSFLQYLIDNNLERKWLIQNVVHDSCLVQVPMQDLEPALKAMQYHFVDGMKKYLEKYFKFTIPLPIECEIEVGLKYGALTKWDGRPSTLGKLIEKLKEDAKNLWSEDSKKGNRPPKECDLLKYKGK